MQRILIVTHGYPPEANAGTERLAAITVEELKRRGFDVALFAAWKDRPAASSIALPADRIFNAPKQKKAALWQDVDRRQRHRFKLALRRFRPDIVYIHHTLYLSYDLPLVAKKFGARVIFMTHDFWLACPRSTLMSKDGSLTTLIDRRRCAECLALHDHPAAAHNPLIKLVARPWLARWLLRRRDRLEKKIYQAVDIFISPSATVARVISRRGVPAGKMRIIPYGLPPLVKTTKGHSDKVRFGFIGTLTPHKGAAWLIDAFKETSDQAELTIWGPLEKPGELASLKDNPRVRYAGAFSIEQTPEIYQQIDCLIVPSRWPENQPLVILQAWQSGTPVIAANLGGMAEMVEHEWNGLLYRWLDRNDLIRQIDRFTDSPKRRQKLSAGAQATKVLTPVEHIDQVLPWLTGGSRDDATELQ